MAIVKALIDTNIWVSSLLNPFGFPAKLRQAFEEGYFSVVISIPLIEELADVINRPKIKNKFKIQEEDIANLIFLIEDRSEITAISGKVDVCRDKDDNHVIEAAIKGKANYLVTRDDDIKFDRKVTTFLSKYGVTAISLSRFLKVINKS